MAITQQQFDTLKARLGKTQGAGTPAQQPQSQGGGFMSDVSNSIQTRGANVANEIQNTQQNPILSGIKATGQAFSALGDVVGAGAKAVAPNLTKAVGDVVQKGFNVPVEALANTKLFQEASQNPEATKKLEDYLQAGGSLGDIANNILLAQGVASTAQGAVDITKATVKKGAELTAQGIKKTGQTVSKTGETTYKSAFDLTTPEANMVQANKINVDFLKSEQAKLPKGSPEYVKMGEQITATQAKAPILRADTALKAGISGAEKNIGVKSGVEKMGLWKNTVEPALKSSKDVLTKNELFAKAEQTVANTSDLTRKASLQEGLDALKADYADFKSTDLLTANRIKTDLANFTHSKIFQGKEVASAVKTLQADMASAIREKTYSSLKDLNIRKAYIDYGNLKQLEKVGIKALTEAGTKGGFGGFWSTVYDAATVPIKTVGGKVLYRVGNKLEFWGDKGVQTLRQHLENQGVTIKKP